MKKEKYIYIMLILLLDLIFIYVSKYSFKDIPLQEFNLKVIGNILNLIFFVIPAVGFIILYYKPEKADKKFIFIIIFLVLLNLPFAFYIVSKYVKLPFLSKYFLGYPLEKTFSTLLFSVHQFILFALTVYIWLLIFGSKNLLLVKSLIYSVLICVCLVLFSFIYTSLKENNFEYNTSKKSDIAVVLGAAVWSKDKASPLFAARINKANNLYNSGMVKKVQVTGGNAPGEISEAQVAFNYLVRYGVNPGDILVETKTASTSEQIAFIRRDLVETKMMKKIIIVSDKFHLRRVDEICKFYNVKAEGIPSDLKFNWYKSALYNFRDSIALLFFWLFALS